MNPNQLQAAESIMDAYDQWDQMVLVMEGFVQKLVRAGYPEDQARGFVLQAFSQAH